MVKKNDAMPSALPRHLASKVAARNSVRVAELEELVPDLEAEVHRLHDALDGLRRQLLIRLGRTGAGEDCGDAALDRRHASACGSKPLATTSTTC